MKCTVSEQLFRRASRHLVGGTGAAGRFLPAIGRPMFIEHADGAYLFDVDGNKFIDYHSSSGATFLGYNHPAIKRALQRALDIGYFCNFETQYHAQLADLICKHIPCSQKVRFANSGTEATLAAIRLSRATTGRDIVLKFEGHFHGMHEMTFYNCHTQIPPRASTDEVVPIPDSAGIPTSMQSLVVVLPFNDSETFLSCMKKRRGQIACVIMEPIMYNAGCVLPKPGFVQLVREETRREGIVLIFDEVLSGFRMGIGGGQEYLRVTPDLCTLGKALGGSGVPIAAVAGQEEVMRQLNPAGNTVMSGTYTGHVLAVIASLEAIKIMSAPGFYDRMNALADRLYDGIREIIQRKKIKATVQGVGARFGLYFGLEQAPIYDYRQVVRDYDFQMNQRFVRSAFEHGLYFHDYGNRLSPTHHGFTAAHTIEDVDETLNRCERILGALCS